MSTVLTPHPEIELQDYSLVGKNTELAIEKGLAEADWYTSPISRKDLKSLLERKDGPPIRDCVIYFGLIAVFGVATYLLWGSWWALLPMMGYGLLWASASDARWHESSHGTAFKTDWLNNLLYEVSSFMVLRESVPWRWSHTRHHSDTIIVGRDPEIAVPRPPDLKALLLKCINFQAFRRYIRNIALHSFGRVTPEEATFIPESEYPKVFFRARIYAAIYLGIVAFAVYFQTWLPFVFVLGPNLYGAWLMPIYGWTQHAGLAENVLDHRLNCRTMKLNIVHRFLYWNMNYHLEHHMFPLVPYHQLPKLHELIKDDCPATYPGLIATYREIIPAVLRQIKDPGYFVKRALPDTARPVGKVPTSEPIVSEQSGPVDGWIEVCDADLLEKSDVVRFDHGSRTYAVYRTEDDGYYATDGICTHGNTHLSDGLVKGDIVECPKHNGRFNIQDGSPARAPVCVGLQTYPVEIRDSRIFLRLNADEKTTQDIYTFEVVSNRNVATFIKELTLKPKTLSELPNYHPGQYMQLDIPAYARISFEDIEVPEPFHTVWKQHHVYDFASTNRLDIRRNYSLATAPSHERGVLKFNVRIATPPRGQDCDAGVGSTYVHSLKPGDTVTAIGPFGDFLIKDTDQEMVYLGGGAGMAPLRSHIMHLFETLQTGRKVSFWYGARSKQEIFYEQEFRELESRFPNFTFHLALSEPQPEDEWDGPTGFIHQHLKSTYLDRHPNPDQIEFYLCGPPVMIQAAQSMLTQEFAVSQDGIAFDEF
ncbi:NADH:ubiquinone reductase (Na(+)-transporting) subunit F [Algisphaera agarilytica]|uniref:Na(+)-translocating NADH-quinone reductase subunit F n=1 Tax=Algisphaera agarilytica TaxID=1385975 RepID=A0A7X0H9E1_9BACT|nr:NADH:ubiquinone reductase (Na(+)-transporting) subunit F [Algisphaera agarilytica]MBB6431704.1 Na(+)-translocating NADH:ubiquinone oxidoreductase F subunit [Algisphaera agarilytica]